MEKTLSNEWLSKNIVPGCIVHCKNTSKKPGWRLVETISTDPLGNMVIVGKHINYHTDDTLSCDETALTTVHSLSSITKFVISITEHGKKTYSWKDCTINKAIKNNIIPPIFVDIVREKDFYFKETARECIEQDVHPCDLCHVARNVITCPCPNLIRVEQLIEEMKNV